MDTVAALRRLLELERRQAASRQAELLRRCIAAEAKLLRLRSEACAANCPIAPTQRTPTVCQRCQALGAAVTEHSGDLARQLACPSLGRLRLEPDEMARAAQRASHAAPAPHDAV